MSNKDFNYGEWEYAIEDICVGDDYLANNIVHIALGFIAEKGLSEDFYYVLEGIQEG